MTEKLSDDTKDERSGGLVHLVVAQYWGMLVIKKCRKGST